MARPQRLPKNSINTASVSSVRISQEFYDERLQKVNDKINATAMQTLDCIQSGDILGAQQQRKAQYQYEQELKQIQFQRTSMLEAEDTGMTTNQYSAEQIARNPVPTVEVEEVKIPQISRSRGLTTNARLNTEKEPIQPSFDRSRTARSKSDNDAQERERWSDNEIDFDEIVFSDADDVDSDASSFDGTARLTPQRKSKSETFFDSIRLQKMEEFENYPINDLKLQPDEDMIRTSLALQKKDGTESFSFISEEKVRNSFDASPYDKHGKLKELAKCQTRRPNVNETLPFHVEKWRWIGDDLPDYVTTSSIRVLVLTWNMHGKKPPSMLKDLLPQQVKHHIVAVGTQECLRSIGKSLVYSNMQKWIKSVTSNLGDEYQMLKEKTLGPTNIILYAHRSIIGRISDVESSTVATGCGNLMSNKGATGVSMNVCGTSLLFVNSHMESGQKKVVKRNKNFSRIQQKMRLGAYRQGCQVQDRFDVTFWFGDFNYRINGPRDAVEFLAKQQSHKIMMSNDQLLREMSSGSVAQGYSEGQIQFPPTYRYDVGLNRFDTSKKQRIPAYTDRILFKAGRGLLEQVNYDSIFNVVSDHRPVFSQFVVHLGTDKGENTPNQKISVDSKECRIF